MRPKIKICGITRVEDALLAESLGADYIGLVFAAGSPRCVSPDLARSITSRLKSAQAVGVFVGQDFEESCSIAAASCLSGIQHYTLFSHKPEPYFYLHALPVRGGIDKSLFDNPVPDYFLLDTYAEKQHGGTGKTFDWSLIPVAGRDRLFIAGGIGAHNIAAAMMLRPYAIDLSSGVEESPGIKDQNKLKHFFAEIDHASYKI